MFNDKVSLKNNYKFYTTVFIAGLFLMTTIISIGYGALNQDLNIAGKLEYEKLKVKASEVSYDNTSSGSSSTTAQQAIDDLYKGYFNLERIDSSGNTTATYTYNYKKGMTWLDFINSSYNSTTAKIEEYGSPFIVLRLNSNGIGYIRKIRNSENDTNFSASVRSSELLVSQTYYVYDDYCCFDPSTLITIDFEGHTKMIKDIEVGDKIIVENIKTKEKKITTVVKDASEHPKTYDMTEITLEDKTTIKFNSYHPIYTTEGYKSVTNYNYYPKPQIGDYMVNTNNEKKKIIDINTYRRKTPQMTYNLLIKGIKEDFLEEEWAYYANGVLVHTGIAEYDDEDDYRDSHRVRCKKQELYKDFNYDKATDKEIIDFLVDLYFKDAEAEKEYIKYYINAKQYFRYTEFAREVKDRIKLYETSNLNKYSKYKRNSFLMH